MIPRSSTHCQTDNYTLASSSSSANWQQQLIASRLSLADLLAQLDIPEQVRQPVLDAAEVPANFPLRVTPSFIARMKKGDINDPLLRQVLPLRQELELQPGFSADPLDEKNYNPVPGLIHKYRGRALLVVAKACAIHCRYCFRRHFPYESNLPGLEEWQQTLDYLRREPSIHEVIYSGGDPLAASDSYLEKLTDMLATIPHIHRLRIHTRLPVVLPQRVDDALLGWLQKWRGQKVVVIHCNHPNELVGEDVAAALARLKNSGVTLLNQTVLLKGINNCADTLVSLSEQLFTHGVLPYYLHLLDKIQGAHHFDVSTSEATALMAGMRARLAGFLLPKLVQEIPGADAKQPL